MTRSLAARLSKLEAARNAAPKVIGIIGGQYGGLIVDPDRPGYLRSKMTHDHFCEFSRRQQTELQAQIAELLAGMDDAEEETTAHVGIAASRKPDGFVFEAHGEDWVVIDGEAQPVKKRKH